MTTEPKIVVEIPSGNACDGCMFIDFYIVNYWCILFEEKVEYKLKCDACKNKTSIEVAYK